MSSITRFFSLGAEDADRRVAAALEARPTEPADRYLKSSAVVIAIDGVTRRLHELWRGSQTARALAGVQAFTRSPFAVRYQAIATMLLTAVVVHVALTVFQGPRLGWFWVLIPAMTAVFAALLLAGSRSSKHPD